MTDFFGRWLAHAVRLILAIALGLGAMQLPAIAHQYAAALVQVADGGRRDIDQREAAARQYYPGAGDTDEQVIAALQPVEPSNASALRHSVDRTRALTAAYDRIAGAAAALRPLVAALDLSDDPTGEKRNVLQTTLDTYVPQVLLTGESALYGVAGLLAGSFAGEALASCAGGLMRRRTHARL